MVVVSMNSMPPKVIGKEACLWARGISRLSKHPDLRSKHLKEGGVKGNKGLKIEDVGVQHNKYDSCCTKQ
jgi:hypothetical protein